MASLIQCSKKVATRVDIAVPGAPVAFSEDDHGGGHALGDSEQRNERFRLKLRCKLLQHVGYGERLWKRARDKTEGIKGKGKEMI